MATWVYVVTIANESSHRLVAWYSTEQLSVLSAENLLLRSPKGDVVSVVCCSEGGVNDSRVVFRRLRS